MKHFILICCLLLVLNNSFATKVDPLPSWHNRIIKQRIIDFVCKVTNKKNSTYVDPADRIAVFDNDGTLWVEHPIYTQFIFVSDQLNKLSTQHPEWIHNKVYKKVINGQLEDLSIENMMKIMGVITDGMTVEAFQRLVDNWLDKKKNNRFKKHYTQLVYQPMLEVLRFLRSNGFTIYIVSGGGQDFIRAFSKKIYHIDTDKVIGSVNKTHYVYKNGKPSLIKKSQLLFTNDKTDKAESIYLFIGKKPIIAFGNSNGDREMLEWTQSNHKPHLMLLVHHDDAKREYDYKSNTKIGSFSESLMNEAKNKHWQIISMKKDWKVIFPFELH